MTNIVDNWRNKRITQLTDELTALTTNIAPDNSMDYIRMQFYFMFGDDRYDKDGWDTEIRAAKIEVFNDGNLYRPDTYYTLELETNDVIILYEYQRVEHYNESWRVYIRLPDKIDGDISCDWIPITNFALIQDVGTDFERELIYTCLNRKPSSGFEYLKPGYCTLPVTNQFIKISNVNGANDDLQLGSLLD
jgi:hypothetical protein